MGPCIQNIVKLTSGQYRGGSRCWRSRPIGLRSGKGPDSMAVDKRPRRPAAGPADAACRRQRSGRGHPGSPDGGVRYGFFDFRRGTPTIIWALAFRGDRLVASWRGLRSILGLIFAFAVLGFFTLPAIRRQFTGGGGHRVVGDDPVRRAVSGARGQHADQFSAGQALVSLFGGRLVGAGDQHDEADRPVRRPDDESAGLPGQHLDQRVAAGRFHHQGALGVLNDVTITQASAAFELAAAGEPSRLATFRAAMRVGRDHIASTVYTLIFAYAGSVPLFVAAVLRGAAAVPVRSSPPMRWPWSWAARSSVVSRSHCLCR